MTDAEFKTAVALARRKEEILAHGVLLRAELTLAKSAVKAQLKPESLMQSAFNQVLLAAFALVKHRAGLSAGGLPRLVPLVVSGVSIMSRKGWLKPVLRLGLIVGGVGAVVALAMRGRRIAAARRAIQSQ